MTKYIYKSLFMLILVLTCTISHEVKACHFAAADISVTYTGPGIDGCTGTTEYKYRVDVTVYFACITCQGVGGQNGGVIRWESESAIADGLPTPSGSEQLFDPQQFPDTVHQLCAAFADSNSCKTNLATANRYPAFKVRRYSADVTLPYARKDWRFWFTGNARSNSNIDLNNPTCFQFYVEAGLDNLTKYNNSTPRFSSFPLPYICVNQTTTYLNAPFDLDGDSVNVEVQQPYTNYQSPCSYLAPSTPTNPIASNSGYKLNKSTGSVSFTPSQTGQFVLAFRGEDYLKGTDTRLSYVYRDVQISVLPCTEPPPDIDSLSDAISSITDGAVIKTSNKGDAIFVCPGSNLSVDFNSKSKDPTHNVYLYANTNTIPGSQFNTAGQGSDNVTGTFEWTPQMSDLGEHTLIIQSKDSTCLQSQPIVLTNYRVILIKVFLGIDAGEDVPFCLLNPDSVQLFVKDADDLKLEWTVNGGAPAGLSNAFIHNPKAMPDYTTTYTVTAPELSGTCIKTDDVTVFDDTSNSIDIFPKNPLDKDKALVMCRPGYLQLEGLIGGKPPKNNVQCGTGNPTLCNNTDTAKIFGSATFGKLTYDSVGKVTPIFYMNRYSSKYQYLIRNDDIEDAEMYSSTIRGLAFETQGTSNPTYEYSNFRILLKCTDKNELKSSEGFEAIGMTEVYYSPSVTLEDGRHYYPFSLPYNWDTTKNLIVQICYSDNPVLDTACSTTSNPPSLKYVPTTYVSALSLKAPNLTVKNICNVIKDDSTQALLGRPAIDFIYCEANPLPFRVLWKEGNYLSDSTIQQPLAYVPESSRYIAQLVGRSGCIMRDTLEVYVPENEYSISPDDTAICFGDETPVSVVDGFYFKWYEYINGEFVKGDDPDAPSDFSISCFDCRTPIISPKRTTEYRIVVSDSVFCYDTLSSRIVVKPLPDVRILNSDTTIKYGNEFRLLASGARIYNWSPVSSLNNPNISYPIARPTEDTRYVLSGLGINGCYAYDTVYVEVDDRAPLFVPSAFSPNGDGRNDEFKVVNLTFQRIMEFRVFNRYGQEIFSTSGEGAGWDGTWNGKPQDVGTYMYLIRIGSPDGTTETYKGEVTLVR